MQEVKNHPNWLQQRARSVKERTHSNSNYKRLLTVWQQILPDCKSESSFSAFAAVWCVIHKSIMGYKTNMSRLEA